MESLRREQRRKEEGVIGVVCWSLFAKIITLGFWIKNARNQLVAKINDKDLNFSIFAFIYRFCPRVVVVVLVSLKLSLVAVSVVDVDLYLGLDPNSNNDWFDSTSIFWAFCKIKKNKNKNHLDKTWFVIKK